MSKLGMLGSLVVLALGSEKLHAESPLVAPLWYAPLAAGDLLSQEQAKSRGALELNPLHKGKLAGSLAVHLAGTAAVVWGDSKLPKKWQKWTLRIAYAVWTGYKVQSNLKARRIER